MINNLESQSKPELIKIIGIQCEEYRKLSEHVKDLTEEFAEADDMGDLSKIARSHGYLGEGE
jgi:hypothetical protein